MGPLSRRLRLAAIAAALACGSGSALAQEEPYRPPTPASTIAPKATSDLSATAPTAAETHEVKALTAAVFAKPAAAAHAVEKVTADSQPDYAVSAPKPNPTAQDGFRPGGKGVEIKAPF